MTPPYPTAKRQLFLAPLIVSIVAFASPLRGEMITFTVDENESRVELIRAKVGNTDFGIPGSVLGLAVEPQDAGIGLETSLTGTLVVDFDAIEETFQIVDGEIIFGNAADYLPGPAASPTSPAPANFGATFTGEGTLFPTSFSRYLSVAGATLDVSSEVQTVFDAGNSQYWFFDEEIDYMTQSGEVGVVDGPNLTSPRYFPLAGVELPNRQTINPGRFTRSSFEDDLRFDIFVELPVDPDVFNLSGIADVPLSIVLSGKDPRHRPGPRGIACCLRGNCRGGDRIGWVASSEKR